MLREGWAHEVIIHLGDGSPLSWTLSPGKAFPVLLIRASVCAACFGTQGRRSEPTVRRVTSFRDSPPTRARGFGRTRTRGRPSRWVSVRATGQEGRKDKEVSRQVSKCGMRSKECLADAPHCSYKTAGPKRRGWGGPAPRARGGAASAIPLSAGRGLRTLGSSA